MTLGSTYVANQGDQTRVIAIARLNTDGTLDTTFGTGGKVVTDLSGIADQAFAIAIQSDGKIVVAGSTTVGPPTQALPTILRYTPGGGLDSTFGTGGVAYLNSALGTVLTVLAVRSDGKIITGGGLGPNLVLLRLNSNGGLDTNFGSAGKLLKSCIYDCHPYSIAFQDDKLLITGNMFHGGNSGILLRLTENGATDRKFGRVGRVISGSVPNRGFSGVLLQADGSIVVGSTVGAIRYYANGNLDRYFSATSFVNYGPGALAQMPDGKIVGAGTTNIPATNGYDFTTVVYNPDGSIFSTARIDLFGSDDIPATVLVQADGKIVVVGIAQTQTPTLNDFVVLRYSPITPEDR